MRLPPLPGFWPALSLLLLFAAAKPILFDTLDPDCFWHLRVGEQLLHDGVGPIHDHLSFSSQVEPWTPYSWLAEIGMYKLWSIGGYRAAILATSLAVAVLFALIAMCCRELVAATTARNSESQISDLGLQARSQRPRAFAIILATLFAAILSLPYLSFRPVTAVILLLAINTWLLLRDRRLQQQSRAVWLILPITLLAANLHLFAGLTPVWCAGFLLGAIIERHRPNSPGTPSEGRAGGRSIASRIAPSPSSVRRYGVLTLSTLIASLATPMLPGMIATGIHYGFHDPMVASSIIAEFRPLGGFSLLLVSLLAVCVIRNRRSLPAGEWICLLIGSCLLLKFGRFAPLFSLIAAPALAVTMPNLSDAVLLRRPVRFAVIAVLGLGTCRLISAFPKGHTNVDAWINRHGPDTPGYPVESAAYVEANIPAAHGRIINEFTWGGYLEWKLGPRFQTLLDGRTQVFPAGFWRRTYLTDDLTRRRSLANASADAAILPASKSLFKTSLLELGWKIVHHDDRAEVLVPPRDAHLAAAE